MAKETPVEDTPIEQPQAETQPVELPEDGTILEGEEGSEKVVQDKDENGNVVGWHKEAV